MDDDARGNVGQIARDFWRELDQVRRERGLSYQRLAKRSAIPHSTLQYWMSRRYGLAAWTEIQPVVLALGEPETTWFDKWKRADRGERRTPAEPETTAVPEDPGDPEASELALTAQAQLPMDIVEFAGRREEVRTLLNLLDLDGPGENATAVLVAVIEGMAGIGKTRLAVHVAHELLARGRGDEVQLYVDLAAHTATDRTAEPATVLAALLRLLGVPGGQIPGSVHERAVLYRDRLNGRRALVVLDNAASEDQVRPLLPGSPGCLVIITSRRKLTGLDGAQPITLPVFDTEDSLVLLSTVVGEERVRAEPEAAREIVERCGYLPLAVSLVARRLRARPTWALADMAARLGVEARRLTELSVSGRAVGPVFTVSYQQLLPEQRRVFRMLALHPGTDFTADSVAALTRTPPSHAEDLLEALLDEHLLEQTTHGRYRFHQLVHSFALSRVVEEESAESRGASLRRLVTWYLHSANQADRQLAPTRRRMPLPPLVDCTPHASFADAQAALRWFDDERTNLLSAMDTAIGEGWDDLAWRLPAILYDFFYLRKHRDDWISTHKKAVLASRRIGDRGGVRWSLSGLGIAYAESRRFTEALECFRTALDIARELGDRHSEGQVINNMGETYRRLGNLPEALWHYEQDLAICRLIADQHGEAVSLNNQGKALSAMKRFDEAEARHKEALAICSGFGDRCTAGEIHNDLGEAYRGQRRLDLAIEHYLRALEIRDEIGDLHGKAQTLHNLGELHECKGRRDTASRRYDEALGLWRQLGDPWAQAATEQRIAGLS